jgi:hypothetical protein
MLGSLQSSPFKSLAIQFMSNLKREKETSISWNKKRKQAENKALYEIEDKMKSWQEHEISGPLSVEMKEEYKSLDLLKRKILQNKEQEWRMRSRALWLQAKDENTNFFHHFANGRKLSNTIWSVDIIDDSKAYSFEDIAVEGTSHFKTLFK